MQKLAKFFQLEERGSTIRVEIMAGLTSFFASAFTILAIPGMIGQGDLQVTNGVFFAATLSASLGTLFMAFIAKIPFIQAPGMGLGSFFAFTTMPALATLAGNPEMPLVQQYQMALTLVFISGILFLLTSLGGIRERIINGIPKNIKVALGSGIGLFITLLGLHQSGLVVASPATFVTLVNFSDFTENRTLVLGALIALAGLFVMGILSARKVKGAILIGIVFSTILSYVTGHTSMPENFSFNLGERFGDFIDVSFLGLDFSSLFEGNDVSAVIGGLLAIVLAFFLVNMLDALGTIFGVASAAGMTNEEGEVIGLKKGLACDALGTTVGSLLGSPTVTTVVSSASGIGEGGRTGLTALVAALLFIASLFLAPFVSLIPIVATAPALIFVGCLMMSQIKEVDFSDMTEAVPAFLAIAMMPLSFSIANGIAFGLISYIVMKLFTGRMKEVKPTAVIIAVLFVLQYFL